jgi:hypothetical protein
MARDVPLATTGPNSLPKLPNERLVEDIHKQRGKMESIGTEYFSAAAEIRRF